MNFSAHRLSAHTLSAALAELPYWNGSGADHLVINLSDMRSTFDTGLAIMVRPSSLLWL